MFDIEYNLVVCGKGKYLKRLECFKKYGLNNIKNYKVLLNILVGTEDIPDITTGWNDKININIVKGPTDQVVCKYYNYYSKLTEKDIKSRWSAKIDDDSINDVAGMIENLDKEYDYERDYYIVTDLRKEEQSAEKNLLIKMGYGYWFGEGNKKPIHELECSITSFSAMKKIINNEKSMEFFKNRALISEGYTDLSLAFAARMVKIYPSEAFFLTQHPCVHSFSMFGGVYNHIHYLSHDVNPILFKLISKRFDDDWNDEFWEKIKNKTYLFSRDQNIPICMINLKKFNIIEKNCNQNPNESFWLYENGELKFLNLKGEVTNIFKNFNNNDKSFDGIFLPNLKIKHNITEINFGNKN